MKKAFTLIELLIVVAIIAILAAIAVPNFLEAQTRAKVSRQLSNMRTVATGIETYTIDNNQVPIVTFNNSTPGSNPNGGSWGNNEIWKFWPSGPGLAGNLTTPVAYLSSVDALEDIFRLPLSFDNPIAYQIMYRPADMFNPAKYDSFLADSRGNTYRAELERYGTWMIRSAGPDMFYGNMYPDRIDYGRGPGGQNRASYDPTNGTISGGDIYRSQKRPEEKHTQK